MGYVYILRGLMKGKLVHYIGSTQRSLDARLGEHYANRSGYTSKLDNKALVWYCELGNRHAKAVEYYLKRHRKGVLGLIKEDGSIALQNLMEWCKTHGIEIGDIKRVKPEPQD